MKQSAKSIINSLATEAQIQKAILHWGHSRNIQIERANVIGTPIKRKDGSQGFRKAPNAGMSDLIMSLVINKVPVCVWLEVKKSGGRLSKTQKEFKDRTERFGGIYAVVKSITDVENLVQDLRREFG